MRHLIKSRLPRAAAVRAMSAAVCLALAGCQTPGANLSMDPGDPCGGERADFAGSRTYFQDKIATGALAGAALGAVGGIAFGLLNGRVDAGTVAVTTLAGGIAGAGSAYYNTLAERARDQDEMAAYMNQDLAREAQEIDHTVVTFARLRACRFGQARYVKIQVRGGMIDRQTGLARIAFHRDHFDQEIGIARQFGLTMARRGQQFQEAANDLRTRPPVRSGYAQAAPRPGYAGRSASPRVAAVDQAVTVSVPEKRASFDRTVAAAQQNSRAAFDIDNKTSLSWLGFPAFDA